MTRRVVSPPLTDHRRDNEESVAPSLRSAEVGATAQTTEPTVGAGPVPPLESKVEAFWGRQPMPNRATGERAIPGSAQPSGERTRSATVHNAPQPGEDCNTLPQKFSHPMVVGRKGWGPNPANEVPTCRSMVFLIPRGEEPGMRGPSSGGGVESPPLQTTPSELDGPTIASANSRPHALPERSEDSWPQLPENLAPGPSNRNLKLPSERTLKIAHEETSPSIELSDLVNGRWPELLQETPSSADEWTEALRARERASRLDAEQRGGD